MALSQKVMRWIAAALAACGCVAKAPSASELLGTWASADGAKVTLLPDGRFQADRMPAAVFLNPRLKGEFFVGGGTWQLEKGQSSWVVHLSFSEPQLSEKWNRVGVPILVERDHGEVVLFQWRGEEGGEQYVLTRKKK